MDREDFLLEITDHSAGDESSGPAGMQDVQVVGFLSWKKGSDHGIDHHLAGAVACGKHVHGDGEAPVHPCATVFPSRVVDHGGAYLQGRGQKVHDEGENHQLPVAELVCNNPPEDDDEAEPGQSASGDVSQLLLGESVFPGPVHQDATPDAKTYARRENGEEAGPQQSFGGC